MVLARIEERLAAHTDRYERDQAVDREDKRAWRGSVETKIDTLSSQMAPVIRDHHFVMKIGKTVSGVAAAVAGTASMIIGAVKAWDWIMERFHS